MGLIVCVLDNVGFKYDGRQLSFYDDVCYSKQPDFDLLKLRFSKYFKEKCADDIIYGDIMLKKVSKTQYHIMIYTGSSFIHASAITRSVVEHSVDSFDDCMIYSIYR